MFPVTILPNDGEKSWFIATVKLPPLLIDISFLNSAVCIAFGKQNTHRNDHILHFILIIGS